MEWSFDEIRGFIPKSISLPYSREEKNGYGGADDFLDRA